MSKIELEAFYPQPIEEVWDALTRPESLAQWYMKNEGFRPEPGARFLFRSKPVMGWKGVAYCEMLKVEKPRLLSWTQGESPEGPPTFTLTWTLASEEGGTRLTLLQDGLQGLRGFMISKFMGAGWKRILSGRLAQLLDARREPRP